MKSLNIDKQINLEIDKLLTDTNLPQLKFMYENMAPLGIVEPNIDMFGDLTDKEQKAIIKGYREGIVELTRRPSLLIKNNNFVNIISETWSNVLEEYRTPLKNMLPSVGRIEMKNHYDFDWTGSGFLLEGNIVVTNRHVAEDFLEKSGGNWDFKTNTDTNRKMKAYIDFREEYKVDAENENQITEIIHISETHDMALLRAKPSGELPKALKLSTAAENDETICVVGYPYEDSRGIAGKRSAARRIFGGIFDVKRLAPGKIKGFENDLLLHDCSTLKGNSGSAVIDIETGKVVGLHFWARKGANLAVKSEVIDAALQKYA